MVTEHERIRLQILKQMGAIGSLIDAANELNGRMPTPAIDVEPEKIALSYYRRAIKLWEMDDTLAAGRLIESAGEVLLNAYCGGF